MSLLLSPYTCFLHAIAKLAPILTTQRCLNLSTTVAPATPPSPLYTHTVIHRLCFSARSLEQVQQAHALAITTGPMFFLSLIEHTLRLPPHLLDLPLDEAIKGELEHLFLDKVIPNLGLCISVYDLRSIDGGFIFPGDGASTYTVVCRLLMFRPFVGEVLSGKVDSSDMNGLRLSVGFFKDIYVPVHFLPNPSKFGEDGRWVWMYEGDELSIENEEEIHFRIQSVKYPAIPIEPEKDAKPFAPMIITASIDHDGLGPVAWWV